MRTFLRFRGIFILFVFFVCPLHGQNTPFPQIPGWKITLSEQIYDSNNLWDIIDGAADLYLEYAFVDLHIARYVNSDSIEVKAELYRHNTTMDAFGIYSQEPDPNYNFINIGAQGYIQSGVLNFLDGIYYIKLSTFQTGDAAEKALLLIAKKFEEHLGQKSTLPKIFQLFPSAGKLINTEQYVARNFLGYSFLKSAATLTYKFENEAPFKLFLIEIRSPGQVKSMLEEYLKTIAKENVLIIANDSYEINDVNNGIVSVTMQNNYLYGIVNCLNKHNRITIMKELSANLAK